MELLIVLLSLESKLIRPIERFMMYASWNHSLQHTKTQLFFIEFIACFTILIF